MNGISVLLGKPPFEGGGSRLIFVFLMNAREREWLGRTTASVRQD